MIFKHLQNLFDVYLLFNKNQIREHKKPTDNLKRIVSVICRFFYYKKIFSMRKVFAYWWFTLKTQRCEEVKIG